MKMNNGYFIIDSDDLNSTGFVRVHYELRRPGAKQKLVKLYYTYQDKEYGPLDLLAGDGILRITAGIINDMLVRGFNVTPPVGNREAGTVIDICQNGRTGNEEDKAADRDSV